ncbi:MAG: YceI family protein [Campylobacterota bacterium]
MFKKTKIVTLGALVLASSLFGADMKIDKSHSNVGFEIRHMMISKVDGRFTEFEGDISIDLDSKALTKLEATIDAASINTDNTKRDDHLRSEDFFYTTKYPEVTFVMKRFIQDNDDDEGKIVGDLTMRGITKEVTLESEITGIIDDRGTKKVGLELEGEVNRKDFGLNWNKVIEAGGIAVGEEVELIINLQLHEKFDPSKL